MAGSESGRSMAPPYVGLIMTPEIIQKLQLASNLINDILLAAKGFRPGETVPIVPGHPSYFGGQQVIIPRNVVYPGHCYGLGLGGLPFSGAPQETLRPEANFVNIKVEPGQEVQSESEHQGVCSSDALHRLAEAASLRLERGVKRLIPSQMTAEQGTTLQNIKIEPGTSLNESCGYDWRPSMLTTSSSCPGTEYIDVKIEKKDNVQRETTQKPGCQNQLPFGKTLPCEYCARHFGFKHSLVLHSKSCKKRHEKLLERHAASGEKTGSVVNQNLLKNAGQDLLMSRMISCNYCERSFPTQHQVTSHERVHTGERPYACYICRVSFAHAGNMIKHIKSKHPEQNAYVCRSCKTTFKTNLDVLNHRKECLALNRKSRRRSSDVKETVPQIVPKTEPAPNVQQFRKTVEITGDKENNKLVAVTDIKVENEEGMEIPKKDVIRTKNEGMLGAEMQNEDIIRVGFESEGISAFRDEDSIETISAFESDSEEQLGTDYQEIRLNDIKMEVEVETSGVEESEEAIELEDTLNKSSQLENQASLENSDLTTGSTLKLGLVNADDNNDNDNAITKEI